MKLLTNARKQIIEKIEAFIDGFIYDSDGVIKDEKLRKELEDHYEMFAIKIHKTMESVFKDYLRDVSKNSDKYDYPGDGKDLKLFSELDRALNAVHHPNARKIRHIILADMEIFREIRNSILHRDSQASQRIKDYANMHPDLLKIGTNDHVHIKEAYIKYITRKFSEIIYRLVVRDGKLMKVSSGKLKLFEVKGDGEKLMKHVMKYVEKFEDK